MARSIIKERGTVHIDCELQGNDNCPPGEGCIEKWKNEKADIKKELDVSIAELENAKKSLAHIEAWERRLKLYFDGIKKTAELADKVCRETKTTITQFKKICKNSNKSGIAIRILFCEVENVFRNENNEDVETLTTMMEGIMKCLRCITDPGLIRDRGIVKALEEFDAKLKELSALQLDTMKKTIEALKCANLLYHALCELDCKDEGNGCDCQDYSCDSLLSEIQELQACFGTCKDDEDCEQPGSSSDTVSDSSGDNQDHWSKCCSKDGQPWECKLACEPQLDTPTLLPLPIFPLKSSDYYNHTEAQWVCAEDEKEKAKCNLDKAKAEKDSLQACYDSLVEAIKAAEQAKAAK
jgi:hypothetical protein